MPPVEDPVAALEAPYRQRVIEQFERLTFRGIARAGKAVSLRLEDVYVELAAVGEVPEAADAFSADERRLLAESEARGVADGDRLRQLDSLRVERWREERRRGLGRGARRSIAEAVADPGRPGLVILGDPGSGKSTLLHYLALTAARTAERLPIFVPLAAYDDWLRRNQRALPLSEFLSVYCEQWRNQPGLAPLFRQALDEGRGLVLLDGLDEVLDVTTRRHIAGQADALIQAECARGNRFVVASRVVGYREAPLSGALPHVTVLDFGEEEIASFAHKWCAACERWFAGGEWTPVVEQQAAKEERDLLAEVRSNPSVLRLAANPLLLTMLALLRRQGGKLPDQRVRLYEQYVEMLLANNWEDARNEGARTKSPVRFDKDLATIYLIELALWLQKYKPSGTMRGRDLELVMVQIALQADGVDPNRASEKERREAKGKAATFVEEMRHFAGLLAERGQDAFGFLHLTFQEYFAGRALARMAPEERWGVVRDKLHLPRWREPILLCAGQIGILDKRTREVSDFGRRVMDAGSPYEELLHRDVFLTAAMAGDGVGFEKGLLDELMGRLVELAADRIPKVRQGACHGLVQLARQEHDGTIGWLLEKIRVEEELGALTGPLQDVIDTQPCAVLRRAFVERLRHGDLWALDVLRRVVGHDEEVRAIVVRLVSDQDEVVRHNALNVLRPLVMTEPKIRQSFEAALADPDQDVVAIALRGLAPLARTDIAVRWMALKHLNNASTGIALAAVHTLGLVAHLDLKARKQLMGLLSSADASLRAAAVSELASLVAMDDGVRDALFCMLTDGDYAVRRGAFDLFVEYASNDETVQRRLLHLTQSGNDVVRHMAWSALRKVPTLRASVRATAVSWMRAFAGAVLARSENPLILGTCVEAAAIALNHDDSAVRAVAVGVVLSAFNPDLPAGRHILADLRGRAAEALRALNPMYGNSAVLRCLVRELQEEPDGYASNAAYQALLRLAVPPEPETDLEPLLHPPPAPGPTAAAPTVPPLPRSHLLHLSDLHFGTLAEAALWYSQLASDLRDDLALDHLDALVLSGDLANLASPDEYAAAQTFLADLTREFHIPPDRIILVPGNHDLAWPLSKKAYKLVDLSDHPAPLVEGRHLKVGDDAARIRDEAAYPQRFAPFAAFHEAVCGTPYPLDPDQQFVLTPLPAQRLLFLGLNSAWELDHHFRARASISPTALARALDRVRAEPAWNDWLKIAVFHHPIEGSGEDRIKDHGFLERLAAAGFRLALHGHIHKAQLGLFRHDVAPAGRRLDIVGAGTFGACTREWVPGYPLQYQLLRVEGQAITVETRRREEINGAWKPDARWTSERGADPAPRYTIAL